MTEHSISSESLKKPKRTAVTVCILFVGLMLAISVSGCLGQLRTENKSIINSDGSLSQYIVMDANEYNQGEIIEFHLINSGSEPLGCDSINPHYFVSYKMENGSWGYAASKPGPMQPSPSFLNPGQSTPVYRLITNDWTPGFYRISFNCNLPVQVINESGKTTVEYQSIFQDFILQEKPQDTNQ